MIIMNTYKYYEDERHYCVDADSIDGWLENPGQWNEEGVFILADTTEAAKKD